MRSINLVEMRPLPRYRLRSSCNNFRRQQFSLRVVPTMRSPHRVSLDTIQALFGGRIAPHSRCYRRLYSGRVFQGRNPFPLQLE